jgi:Big-like domain-containing protein
MLSTVRVLPRRVAIVTALVMVLLAWVLGASHLSRASAAPIDGAITNVSIQQTDAGTNTNMRLDLTWAVPDSASSGDTFTLTLPNELTSVTTGFDLLAPDGSVVATAHVAGKVVTFTLTTYADTHVDVHGGAFFSVKWDQSNLPTEGPVTLKFTTSTTVYTDTVNYTGSGTIDRTVPRKAGHWADPDVHSGADALVWTLNSPSGPFNKVTFHDTIGAGQALDCATVKLQLGSNLDSAGHPGTLSALPASKIITNTCSASSLTIAAGPILADQIIVVRYSVDITDPTLAKYSNSATVTVDGTSYGSISDNVRVPAAGGSGTGTNTPSGSPTSTSISPTSTSATSTSTSATSTSTSSSATVSGTSTSTTVGGPTVLPTKISASSAVGAGLAFTGANIGPLLIMSVLLLGGGLVFAMAGRKPRGHRKH